MGYASYLGLCQLVADGSISEHAASIFWAEQREALLHERRAVKRYPSAHAYPASRCDNTWGGDVGFVETMKIRKSAIEIGFLLESRVSNILWFNAFFKLLN